MACKPDKTEVDLTYALAFMAILYLVLIDVGGYIRSPTPAAQDIRVLVDSHQLLSNMLTACASVHSLQLVTLVGLENIWTVTNASCCT